MSPVSRGFRGRSRVPAGEEDRVPPGQYVTTDFPVLSAGPTPHTPPPEWTFSITQGGNTLKSWTWQEMQALPAETVTVDIHCVTRWSKLDTQWQGVSMDTLLDQVAADAPCVLAFCDGGYTTNLPVEDVTGGKAWVAFGYDDAPLEPEHGGPARLLVPHLYFWKSAKWVRGLELRDYDAPGFWESYGYHLYGDPWKQQRYAGD
jgi:DMSO/TMAO reductase YedYZ molybdopterin-dependent catalytic subunit